MSTAELGRQTGLSETTIRYLGTTTRNDKSSLVAISAVLRWRYDHLTNILHGQPEKNVHVRPPPLANLERIMREELGSLRQQVHGLAEALAAVSGAPGQVQQAHQQQEGLRAGRQNPASTRRAHQRARRGRPEGARVTGKDHQQP
jgi:hypothetical protein